MAVGSLKHKRIRKAIRDRFGQDILDKLEEIDSTVREKEMSIWIDVRPLGRDITCVSCGKTARRSEKNAVTCGSLECREKRRKWLMRTRNYGKS